MADEGIKERVSFPGHEKAIEILEKAQKELEALRYEVEFTKTLTTEELLPVYSNTHFWMKLAVTRPYWKKPSEHEGT